VTETDRAEEPLIDSIFERHPAPAPLVGAVLWTWHFSIDGIVFTSRQRCLGAVQRSEGGSKMARTRTNIATADVIFGPRVAAALRKFRRKLVEIYGSASALQSPANRMIQ
jgi:hypothetical protein